MFVELFVLTIKRWEEGYKTTKWSGRVYEDSILGGELDYLHWDYFQVYPSHPCLYTDCSHELI